MTTEFLRNFFKSVTPEMNAESSRIAKEITAATYAAVPLPSIPRVLVVGSPEYYDSMIDCAAVKSTDGQVWTGKRHGHCIRTIKQAGLEVSHRDQGFVTMSGKYVSRKEGAALVLETGQCRLNTPPLLYSEDLY